MNINSEMLSVLGNEAWQVLGYIEVDGARYSVAARRLRSPNALTEREKQAMRLVGEGLTNKEVAYEMGISASTVAVFLTRARKKMGLMRAASSDTVAA